MPLNIGDKQATSGMSEAIYEELKALLEPPLKELVDNKKMEEGALNKVREGWQKLAYAIAKGVIKHMQSNAEVTGVQITVGNQVYTQTNKGKVG